MTKEEFFESFYKDYPFSCMTVKDLWNIIKTYNEDTMPFTICGEWSWRGIYEHPCLGISNGVATKEENLQELRYLLTNTFEGWKGGDYKFQESSLVHFESGWGDVSAYGDEYCYFVRFMKNNEDNPFVKHIIDYFVNDRQNEVKYYQDVLGNDLVEGRKIVFYDDINEKLSVGHIKEILRDEMTVLIEERLDNVFASGPIKYQEITFDKIAQV